MGVAICKGKNQLLRIGRPAWSTAKGQPSTTATQDSIDRGTKVRTMKAQHVRTKAPKRRIYSPPLRQPVIPVGVLAAPTVPSDRGTPCSLHL